MQGIDGTLQPQGDPKYEHPSDDALNRLTVALHVAQNNGWSFAEVWFVRAFTTLVFCVGFERPIGAYQIYDDWVRQRWKNGRHA